MATVYINVRDLHTTLLDGFYVLNFELDETKTNVADDTSNLDEENPKVYSYNNATMIPVYCNITVHEYREKNKKRKYLGYQCPYKASAICDNHKVHRK